MDSNTDGKFSVYFNSLQTGKIGTFSFLPTIIVPLWKDKDDIYRVRTLLDSGAGHSWITKEILKHVNYTSMPSQKLTIGTLNGTVKRKCRLVQVYFKTSTFVPIECFVLDDFVEHVTVEGIKDYIRDQSELKEEDIKFIIEPSDNRVDHANINLGTALVLSNAATALLCPRVSTKINLKELKLILEPTIFGTAVSGQIPQKLRGQSRVIQAMCAIPKICEEHGIINDSAQDIHTMLGYRKEVLEDEVKFLWDKYTLGIFQHEVHDDDLLAIERLEGSMKHLTSGQFEVGLPFNAKLHLLQPNKELAMARTFKQLQDMNIKTKYKELLVKAKTELELNDYIEKVSEYDVPGRKIHYLPWRGIMKEESNTTKLRIVMDASAKTSASAVSLNQCLYQGPNMIINLAKCLIRFMLKKFRCVADIEKAFLRIIIAVEDRDVLRFFWPEDPSDPRSKLIEYKWKAVLFGSISSPFILASVLKRLINDNSTTQYTREALLNGIYVDNLFHSDDSEEKLAEFFTEARRILQSGNFNLREWGSNSKLVRNLAHKEGVLFNDSNVGALGLWWSQVEDKFQYKKNFKWNQKHTKRSVLSFTNAVFDPLNWLCPIHIQNRLFIRDLWAKEYKWDFDFSKEQHLVERWAYLRHQCFSAVGLEVGLNVVVTDNTKVHVFCDASKQAYGAVLYLVTPECEQCPLGQVKMIKAKGKIVPVNKDPTEDSMPRWELGSILIAANLLVFVLDAVPGLEEKEKTIWNDNKAALSWCSQVEIKDTYVHNRVVDIRKKCPNTAIRYVPTNQNPADILTRDITAEDLKKCDLWWNGPSWIMNKENWPVTEQVYNLHPPVIPQFTTVVQPDINNPLRLDLPCLHIFKDHRFNISLRSLAWILRWRNNKQKDRKYYEETINAEELAQAKVEAIKIMQTNAFSEELTMLQKGGKIIKGKCAKLRLFLDNKGIMRCQSRVEFTLLKRDLDAPILADTNSDFITSYLKNLHVTNNCAGVNFTLNAARQDIYAHRLPALIKKIIGQCMICARYRAHPYRYPMQPVLPKERSLQDIPFTCTAVDYSGPHMVRNGQKIQKTWVCMFSCLTSRAVYLVLVDNLRSTTFLNALKELACRRTTPKVIISDNATTFVHASKILKYIASQDDVMRELADKGITWKWVPERAAWTGGVYEILIKSLKQELYKLCGTGLFSKEDFKLHLVEVEIFLNSRPLVKCGQEQVITPNHILNGAAGEETSLLLGVYTEDTLERVLKARKELPEHYQELRKRREKFWEALQTQYLESLRFTRDKMSNQFLRTPKKNDICLIYAEDPRYRWKLAKILRVITSEDGQVRQCEIKTAHGTTTRATNCLFPLELHIEEDAQQDKVEVQIYRADKHKAELAEVRKKIKEVARKDKTLSQQELDTIITKIDEEQADLSERLQERPRRKAALAFLERNKQMASENQI